MTTDPPDVFEAAIQIHWPCPTRRGLAVDCFYVEIEGLSLRKLFLISVLTFFNVKAQVPPRAPTSTNDLSKQTCFPRLPP